MNGNNAYKLAYKYNIVHFSRCFYNVMTTTDTRLNSKWLIFETKSWSVTIQMKTQAEQFFPVVLFIMPFKMVQTVCEWRARELQCDALYRGHLTEFFTNYPPIRVWEFDW